MSAKLKEISDHTGLDKAKNPLPSEAYPVVIADVNYGLNKKQSRGDQVAWSSVDFRGFFENVKDANKADSYVVIVFLHHAQQQVCFVIVLVWILPEYTV